MWLSYYFVQIRSRVSLKCWIRKIRFPILIKHIFYQIPITCQFLRNWFSNEQEQTISTFMILFTNISVAGHRQRLKYKVCLMAVSTREGKIKQERKVESCKLVRRTSGIGCHWGSGLETVRDGAMEISCENIPGSPVQSNRVQIRKAAENKYKDRWPKAVAINEMASHRKVLRREMVSSDWFSKEFCKWLCGERRADGKSRAELSEPSGPSGRGMAAARTRAGAQEAVWVVGLWTYF